MLSEEAKDLCEGAKDLFKKFCDGNESGTVFKYYSYALGRPPALVINYSQREPIIGEEGREIANLESYFQELINKGYLKLIEKNIATGQETYKITKEGYDFYNKELFEVK